MTDPESRREAEERLRRLLETYGAFLHATVRRLCAGKLAPIADEVEQDVRVRVWRAVESAREIADPASYIYRTAATATIDAVRRIRARREEPIETVPEIGLVEADAGSPQRRAISRELTRMIQEALMTIPESRRQPVRLHLMGFTTEEVARLTGSSEPKARSLVYRGLADLRRELLARGVDVEG